ncbi:MAG TPA: glycerophosphodiester phosphodiesterase [Magnetospirillaceae bacterium]|nr:glycerophosphodiester phosphodiesterase [Magnetospirillaceae bacterium]
MSVRRSLLSLTMLSSLALPAAALDIEAHRGGRALFPENTLVSFSGALTMGVNTLELDMGITKDDVIVVSHERWLSPDLARGPDGNYVAPPGIPYMDIPLSEVKKYDVGQIRPGSKYAESFPDQKPVPGTKVPTLAEVFALVKKSGDSQVKLNIETKIDPDHPENSPDPDHFVTLLLELLKKEHFEDRVMVQSFDWRTLQLVQKRAPKIPTVYLTIQKGGHPNVTLDKPSNWTAGFDPITHGGTVPAAIKAAGGAIWSPLYMDIDKNSVDEAHRLGLTVVTWTVNKPEDMERLIDIGVDGIISDRPDLLREAAKKKGIALPAGHPVSP